MFSDSSNINVNSSNYFHSETYSKQDEILNDMSMSLKNLELASAQIGNELDSQNNMLVDINEDVDSSNYSLAIIDKKMDKIAKKTTWKCRLISIIVLIVLIVLLLMIIIYT